MQILRSLVRSPKTSQPQTVPRYDSSRQSPLLARVRTPTRAFPPLPCPLWDGRCGELRSLVEAGGWSLVRWK